ncbi:MAG TPA: rhomboid family intramembrane serine protease [Thermoanaerobaculia bacterium]|jgi:membrane associated rhomboid family serine protease|nr:rhomboid family intramembrane serine protease [Thermoanaerobaculia bacterium]
MKTAITLTLLAVAAALLPGSWLELQRGGAVWRIATCHFTHFTYEQLVWDALVFLLLGIASARRDYEAFRTTLLASVVIVPLAVLAFSNVTTYRGLSGIDSALFGLLLATDWRRNWIVALCGVAFAAKMIFELTTGATVFVHSDVFTVVPVAHIAGALVGVAIGSICGQRRADVTVPLPRSGANGSRWSRRSTRPPDRRFARAVPTAAAVAE